MALQKTAPRRTSVLIISDEENNQARYDYKRSKHGHPPNAGQYLSWVGIGRSLVGQGQRVRLGHGVIAIGTQ